MSENTWPQPSDVNRVISKVNSDQAFRSLLLKDANAALNSIGIEVPHGLTVRVHENTESTVNYILPPASRGAELSDATLEAVSGGIWDPSGCRDAITGNTLNPALGAVVYNAGLK